MLFIIILLIKRRFKIGNDITLDINQITSHLKRKCLYLFLFLLVSFTSVEHKPDPIEVMQFDIIKKSKVIGFIDLQKINSIETTTYRVSSEVNTKILLDFKAKSNETYVFRNDTLIYSSIYRTINEKVKVNQSLSYKKGSYLLKQKKGNHLLNKGVIKFNLIQMYIEEPVNIQQVYCDKLNLYLPIKKIDSNRYKIRFPNRSYNIFNYENGKCVLVEAVGSFYKVKVIPSYKDQGQKLN